MACSSVKTNVIHLQVGLNFMVYESVRKYLTYEGEQSPGAARKLLAGAVSGAVAQTFTYPLCVMLCPFNALATGSDLF